MDCDQSKGASAHAGGVKRGPGEACRCPYSLPLGRRRTMPKAPRRAADRCSHTHEGTREG